MTKADWLIGFPPELLRVGKRSHQDRKNLTDTRHAKNIVRTTNYRLATDNKGSTISLLHESALAGRGVLYARFKGF